MNNIKTSEIQTESGGQFVLLKHEVNQIQKNLLFFTYNTTVVTPEYHSDIPSVHFQMTQQGDVPI